MISEQEAREALRVYKDGTTPTVRGFASLVAIEWEEQELASREAERAERALPITAEWIKSLGFLAENGYAGLWLDHVIGYEPVYGSFVVCSARPDITTRGQLIDLLAALKGGAS